MRENTKMKKQMVFIMMLLLIATSNSYGIPISVSADTANSTEGLGSFTGSFDYSFSSDTAAQITVELTNTSPVGNGGYLTAFAFNNPFDSISSVVLSGDTSGNFSGLGGASYDNSISASPWGDFDIGASTTSSWLGNGNPNTGIGVSGTETFIFDLIGTGLDQLTNQNFIDELSTGGGGGAYWFGARFRGFEDGDSDSDKVPGSLGGPGQGTLGLPVPEPSTIFLLGIGLAGLIRYRKRL
jgi:hypothetical protein